METPVRFIVIDDDKINNMLCSFFIEAAAAQAEIRIFEDAQKGYEYIKKRHLESDVPTIIFLDINMPNWSGWNFLDNFEKLDEKIKNQIRIYMLSSSIDPSDKQQARDNKNVVDYIEKPLSEEIILSIITEQRWIV